MAATIWRITKSTPIVTMIAPNNGSSDGPRAPILASTSREIHQIAAPPTTPTTTPRACDEPL